MSGAVTGRGYTSGFAITPSDSVNFTGAETSNRYVVDAIFVGGAGQVSVILVNWTPLTFVGIAAGDILPVRARRVNSTGTTATNLVGLLAFT